MIFKVDGVFFDNFSNSSVQSRLCDTTLVDSTRFMDDSGYRGHIGGCVATTLGSVLHELGHAFDLGHTQHGIMARYQGLLTF